MHYSVQKASAHETNMDTWHMANLHDNSTNHTPKHLHAPPWSAVAAAVQLQAGLGASGRRHACSLERLRPVRPSSWARGARCLLPGRLGAGREVPGRRATREGGAAAEQASSRTRMPWRGRVGRRERRWRRRRRQASGEAKMRDSEREGGWVWGKVYSFPRKPAKFVKLFCFR